MTRRHVIKVGTRRSRLSRLQTQEVLRALRRRHPHVEFRVVPIVPTGDRRKEARLLDLGRGAFAKELEVALLRDEIDCAVHSAKDLPSSLPDGLVIAAIPPRQDPRDALVNRWGAPLEGLPPGARLGTGSPRRRAQLLALRPDLRFLDMRGNVDTRLAKARGADYDGAVLAAAGLKRLGLEEAVAQYLPAETCTPDAGQGALAVEARADDQDLRELLAAVDHGPTRAAVEAERAFVAAVGGGCRTPVAAYAEARGDRLSLLVMAATPDGRHLYRLRREGHIADPVRLGRRAAADLLDAGARRILEGADA